MMGGEGRSVMRKGRNKNRLLALVMHFVNIKCSNVT